MIRNRGPQQIEHKIVLVGPMGAGKTTIIRSLSDEVCISTDVTNYDRHTADKLTTTVGFDYGRIFLSDGQTVRLVGTPGQDRFGFLWPSLTQGAKGIVVLIDMTSADPVRDLRRYLDRFPEFVASGLVVVCLSKLRVEQHADLKESISEYLMKRAIPIPLLDADVRLRSEAKLVLEALLMQIELYADLDDEHVNRRPVAGQKKEFRDEA